MKMRCINPIGAIQHLTLNKVYDGIMSSDGRYFRTTTDGGKAIAFAKHRFEHFTEEPKMGAIYLICVIINHGLKAKDFDVIPDDLVNETFIEHSLDAAKKHLEELNAAIQEEGKSCDQVACIFELHSYYENRPFFVEVQR